ncbi:MAG: nucleoside recognition protein [Campylobacterales bacterium]|nr:nucleoside recognition protein [Campylobacterales bacterium]
MKFSLKTSLGRARHSAWIVLKLIVPIYILADVLFYYELLGKISFIFIPLTTALDLPSEAALSLVSGIFLNLYAAIAFAAPLGLSAREWTILAVFLGICHALLVETLIMHRLQIPRSYSILLRFGVGLFAGWVTALLPVSWFGANTHTEALALVTHSSFAAMLLHSLQEASLLALEVMILVGAIILLLDFIKSLSIIDRYAKRVTTAFSLGTGTILGITYGAGVLISEYENATMSTKEVWFVGTFLMICHAIIEDTILFVIFGANPWVIVCLRLFFATVFAFAITLFLTNRPSLSRTPK